MSLNVIAGLAVVGATMTSCAARPPVISMPTPWRDHPIDPSVAGVVEAGMTAHEVIRIAGRPLAAGTVTSLPPEAGPATYHVHFDVFANREWSNSTWIYVIRLDGPASSTRGDWCLFLEMKDDTVAKAYQGRWTSWGM